MLAQELREKGALICSRKRFAGQKKSRPFRVGSCGDYLLFRFRSTIGVIRFNFSVRNGKRWIPYAIITLISFLLLRCLCIGFQK